MASDNINIISENLLFAVKKQQAADTLLAELGNLQISQVQNDLWNDDLKKAYWINVYNAFFQILKKVEKV